MVVEALPFVLPPGPLRSPEESVGAGPPGTIEIAEFGGDANVALGSVRRHLLINSTAALVLLFAVALIGSRFRSYVRGKELAHQIEIACSVQRDLLPSATAEVDQFDVAGDYVPVAGVSGDYYDVFSVSGGRVAFVLGDVAGKGIPAAVLMGVLHGAVRSSSWMESTLNHHDAMQNINRLLCERAAANRFATLFWSYFDPRSQHLKFINAGHCPPLLVKNGRRGPVLRLQAGGTVLGLVPGVQFEQGSVRLDAGDRLILYTDGIVEAMNASGEEFGEDRLVAVIRDHSEDTAEAMRDAILRAIVAFTEQPHSTTTERWW
jgi:phosphoserine phosphatase RsbU/P